MRRAVVSYAELELAFAICDQSQIVESVGFVCTKTGVVHIDGDEEGTLPADLYENSQYVRISNKQELDLGISLAFNFVLENDPEIYDQVRSIFRSRGAYHRFKELLASRQKLFEWHDFETNAVKNELTKWCDIHGIEVSV